MSVGSNNFDDGYDDGYDVGYFEGIRQVMLFLMNHLGTEGEFLNWLNEELAEALRIRDGK